MSIYVVSPGSDDRFNTMDSTHALLVSAGSVADARSICKHYRYFGVSPAAWDAATVTEITDNVATSSGVAAGMSLGIVVPDASTTFNVMATGVLGVESAAVAAGGTGYSVNDILTVAGGTFSRSARFRVTSLSGSSVNGISLADPGEYSVVPSATQSTTVSPAGGTGCTLTAFVGSSTSFSSVISHAVSLLNARSDISNASLDLSAATPLLTVAGAADNLGDKTLNVSFYPAKLYDGSGAQLSQDGIPLAGLVGTITDQGAVGAALTVEIPTLSTLVIPRVVPFV